jgi:outer membrane protein assembly factor BamA
MQARPVEMGAERVRVVYEITEGPLIFINRLVINNTGLRTRTRPDRARTFLRFKEGDRLRNDELTRSEQDLYAIGAFRRVVIRSEPLGQEEATGEAQRNVYVDLDEGKSRVLVYGAGYQSDEGARGILEISDPNIFGQLNTVSLRLRGSNRNLLGQLSYANPRPFGLNTPALLSLLLQKQRRPAFDSRRATLVVQTERRLSDQSLLLFRYNYEDVRVTNPASVTDRRDQPVRLSRLSASYAFDGRNNPFDAQTGRYHTADFTFAVRALGGNEQFFRLFTENQVYYGVPHSGGVVLAGDVRLGLARNIGTRPDLPPDLSEQERARLPITERFFSGGSTTLRGYDFEQAGPRDANNRPLGGNALVIINAEIRRPLYRQISLIGFYDTGNVFRTINDISFKNFTHTVGAGLRFRTPLGPFRVDLGYLASDPFTGSGLPPAVAQNLRLSRLHVHISFGQAF